MRYDKLTGPAVALSLLLAACTAGPRPALASADAVASGAAAQTSADSPDTLPGLPTLGMEPVDGVLTWPPEGNTSPVKVSFNQDDYHFTTPVGTGFGQNYRLVEANEAPAAIPRYILEFDTAGSTTPIYFPGTERPGILHERKVVFALSRAEITLQQGDRVRLFVLATKAHPAAAGTTLPVADLVYLRSGQGQVDVPKTETDSGADLIHALGYASKQSLEDGTKQNAAHYRLFVRKEQLRGSESPVNLYFENEDILSSQDLDTSSKITVALGGIKTIDIPGFNRLDLTGEGRVSTSQSLDLQSQGVRLTGSLVTKALGWNLGFIHASTPGSILLTPAVFRRISVTPPSGIGGTTNDLFYQAAGVQLPPFKIGDRRASWRDSFVLFVSDTEFFFPHATQTGGYTVHKTENRLDVTLQSRVFKASAADAALRLKYHVGVDPDNAFVRTNNVQLLLTFFVGGKAYETSVASAAP